MAAGVLLREERLRGVRGSEVRGREGGVGVWVREGVGSVLGQGVESVLRQGVERVAAGIVRKGLGLRRGDEGRAAERGVRVRVREGVEGVPRLELAAALGKCSVGCCCGCGRVCGRARGEGHLDVFFDGRFGEVAAEHGRRAVAVLVARRERITSGGGGAIEDSTRR